MSVEVVVPWLPGCPYRQRAFDWLVPRYQWPVTVAGGPTPWNKALAVAPAVEASSAEIVIVADADVWTDGLPAAVEAVIDGAGWALPHRGVFRLTAESSKRFTAGASWRELATEERPYLGLPGGGYVVARRETLLRVPFDSRFVGWGGEDESLAIALDTLAGHRWRGKAPLIHLYHPPQERMSRRWGSVEGRTLARRYHAARNHPERMEQIVREAHDANRRAAAAMHPDHAVGVR